MIKMKKFKKFLPLIALFLIINAIFTISITAYKIESSVDNDRVDRSLNSNKFDDVSIHLFCFVKAGYVDIRTVVMRGFWFANFANFFYIGNIVLNLKCFGFEPDEPRLIVTSLLGKTIYENDICVSLKGFIGSVRPTGSIDSGHLKGFALIAIISQL
jgi:hypothetical protein